MITIIINKFLEFLGIKRVSSGTLILRALLDKPLTNTEIRQIAFDNRTNNSRFHKDFIFKDEPFKPAKYLVKKVPTGWFCCGVNGLLNNNMISYNEKLKKYEITETGKLNINTPYTIKPVLSHKEYTKRINILQDRIQEIWHKNNNSYLARYLYNFLDAINGELTEKGWENFDTYSNNFFEDYSQTLELLKKINSHYGYKAEKKAVQYGLIEIVENREGLN